LVILIQLYFPMAHIGAFGTTPLDKATFQAEAFGRYSRPKANTPGTLASLDAMLADAQKQWVDGKPYFVRVWHPGDAASYVEVRRGYAHDVTMNLDQIFFDAQSGRILHRFEASSVVSVQRFLVGMHFIQFDHWGLRWLYLAAGLSGCVMIATGLIVWLASRRLKHTSEPFAGFRVVEALTVGSVTGILVATGAFLVTNRLLPLDFNFAGQPRAVVEAAIFYAVWLLTFVHGSWTCAPASSASPHRAWQQQCWAIAVLALLAMLLNALTTGDHLLATVARGDFQVAGVDLMLLVAAGMATGSAVSLSRSASRFQAASIQTSEFEASDSRV
jgi:hypothetical protein